MSFDLNEITSVIPIVFAIIAIVVYYFDKIIVDLSPHEPEIRGNHLLGILFTLNYVLIPFLMSVALLFFIFEFFKIDPNTLESTFGINILIIVLFILLFVCMMFIYSKLKYIIDSEMSPIEEQYEKIIFAYSFIPSFIIYSIVFLTYYIYVDTPTQNIFLPALYYSVLLFFAFILYTSIATIHGFHMAEYPYAKIVMLNGQTQLEGKIRKFGELIILVNDDATYHITMSNISFIEISPENK